ncbi:MAG TPA: CYTH domain-containing protein [Myxococcales bacterium]
MGTEIERKFLVRTERLPKDLPEGNELEQGYLSVDPTVRVRLVTGPEGTRHAELTIKGKGLMSRAEFNYPIPNEDAEALLGMCARSLRKVRRKIGRFELDHFRERDLWLAEIELADERERFQRPPWLGDEVTNDPEYANSRLATPRGAS